MKIDFFSIRQYTSLISMAALFDERAHNSSDLSNNWIYSMDSRTEDPNNATTQKENRYRKATDTHDGSRIYHYFELHLMGNTILKRYYLSSKTPQK